ncbi:hypothetical protein HGA91_02145 [candidate division WWE3 bacterium]|nr:hypothetical protein [candidate division WWE3 bacterium]
MSKGSVIIEEACYADGRDRIGERAEPGSDTGATGNLACGIDSGFRRSPGDSTSSGGN